MGKGNFRDKIKDILTEKPQILINKIFNNHFKIIRYINSGATANVYAADYINTDGKFPRKVAIKIYKNWVLENPNQADRIINEIETMTQIIHPNLMRIFGCDIHSDEQQHYVYMIMEYLEGVTLTKFIEKEIKTLSQESRQLAIIGETLYQICNGVKALHSHSPPVIHRDLKPDNIIILRENGQIVVKITDFGVVKKLEDVNDSLTKTGHFFGTLRYSAPEWVLGKESSFKTDLYSIGAICYKLLSTKEPFHWVGNNRTAIGLAVQDENLFEMKYLQDHWPPRATSIDRYTNYISFLGYQLTEKDPQERSDNINELTMKLEGEREYSEWWISSLQKYYYSKARAQFFSILDSDEPYSFEWVLIGNLYIERSKMMGKRSQNILALYNAFKAFTRAFYALKWEHSSSPDEFDYIIKLHSQVKLLITQVCSSISEIGTPLFRGKYGDIFAEMFYSDEDGFSLFYYEDPFTDLRKYQEGLKYIKYERQLESSPCLYSKMIILQDIDEKICLSAIDWNLLRMNIYQTRC